MSDHDRGAYAPPTDAPLSFDARQPVRGSRPLPVTLIISVLVLAGLGVAIFMFYRGGVRQAGQPPQAVGQPVPAPPVVGSPPAPLAPATPAPPLRPATPTQPPAAAAPAAPAPAKAATPATKPVTAAKAEPPLAAKAAPASAKQPAKEKAQS